jgi:hypothetical protein
MPRRQERNTLKRLRMKLKRLQRSLLRLKQTIQKLSQQFLSPSRKINLWMMQRRLLPKLRQKKKLLKL